MVEVLNRIGGMALASYGLGHYGSHRGEFPKARDMYRDTRDVFRSLPKGSYKVSKGSCSAYVAEMDRLVRMKDRQRRERVCMENMGVLQTPEKAGVVPTFVVPSMLRPKSEPGEWRCVSDFTPLNIHIKKLQTVNPTIEEVKQKLAKFKYNIELDLSNYFWQQGMKLSDRQYLGTPHPFKGLRV